MKIPTSVFLIIAEQIMTVILQLIIKMIRIIIIIIIIIIKRQFLMHRSTQQAIRRACKLL